MFLVMDTLVWFFYIFFSSLNTFTISHSLEGVQRCENWTTNKLRVDSLLRRTYSNLSVPTYEFILRILTLEDAFWKEFKVSYFLDICLCPCDISQVTHRSSSATVFISSNMRPGIEVTYFLFDTSHYFKLSSHRKYYPLFFPASPSGVGWKWRRRKKEKKKDQMMMMMNK